MMQPADALATIAYMALPLAADTSIRLSKQITLAVVRSSPLLELHDDPSTISAEVDAVKRLIERHQWNDKAVILLDAYIADRLRKSKTGE